MKPARHGVILFDDPETYDSGWACIAGEEPYRIQSLAHTPSDTVFLTNLTSDQCWKTGLNRNPRIRHNGFLRTTLTGLIAELGLKGEPPFVQTKMIAELFGSVMELCRTHYGIEAVPAQALARGMAEMHGRTDGELSQAASMILKQSSQSYVQCEKTPYREGNVNLVFWCDRTSHIRQILGVKAPAGQIMRVGPDMLPEKSKRLEWLKNLGVPVLAKVTVHNVDPAVHTILNYASGAGTYKAKTENGQYQAYNQREWMVTPEILLMEKHAKLEIHDVIMFERFQEPEHLRSTIERPSKACEISYAYGLMMENVWAASQRSLNGKVLRHPQTAWMQALDRITCFVKAKELYEAGIDILGYGYGHIQAVITEDRLGEIPEIAESTGLMIPMQGKYANKNYIPHRQTGARMLQALFIRGDQEQRITIDRKAVEESRKQFEEGKADDYDIEEVPVVSEDIKLRFGL